MRFFFPIAASFITLLAFSSFVSADETTKTDSHPQSLTESFNTPPQSARPYLWWHWMDGNVTKEGIKKDLEWMNRIGIGGFHQFDAGGINMPRGAKVKLPYLSDGWKDAFRYALNYADSLGFEIGIASAPGWSSTGGPWVEPQDAMKKLEWKSIDVKGGKTNVKLPELYRTVGSYQDFEEKNDRIDVKPYGEDLYVIAIRLKDADLSMKEMGAKTTASEGAFTCQFASPQTIKAFTLKCMARADRPREGEPEFKNILEASNDGITWKEVHKIMPSRIPYITEDIVPTRATWFRVRGEMIEDLQLFTVTKVNHSEELGGFSVTFDFNKFHTPQTSDAIKTSDVVDLTGKMTADGKLSCTLPKGRWRIYRFGYSITGKVNHPSSPEATGLEVDKLDSKAWSKYFKSYLDLYKEASGGLIGEKGITRLLVDSYEAGPYTWTPSIVEEFKARRGYDLIKWLPVLTGEVIGSADESERFLWDWRKTLGELFSENYNKLGSIIKEYGMQGLYIESHEGSRAFTGDGMDAKRNATVPMAAIWMENTPSGSAVPAAIADIKESASVAHIFGQNIVAAESFTVDGRERKAYTYCPENMKYVADVALSAGLNRFVIHESSSQPNDDYLPGMQLFGYGQWFHRNETWAEYAGSFMNYLARNCYMLQQGHAVADILIYYGEDSNETAHYGGHTFGTLPKIPAGYEYDFANPYVLLNSVKAENNGLVTKTGMEYKVLWMDKNCETMSVEVLRKIAEFAQNGVTICGKAPKKCAGMKQNTKEFDALVKKVWNSGRKNVTENLDEAIAVSGAKPDFIRNGVAEESNYKGLRYVHRKLADSCEIYWVRNFSDKEIVNSLSFRDGGDYAYIFNPETGRICPVEVSTKDGRSVVKARLGVTDAIIILFSDSALDCSRAFVGEGASNSKSDSVSGSALAGTSASAGAKKAVAELDKKEYSDILTVNSKWDVHFEQKGGGVADESFETLASWTERTNPVVRYYSGTATYKTSLNLSEVCDGLHLDLGEVKNIAEVFINGQSAGICWKAPFRTGDISKLLKVGENTIEIKVANLWPNRMIGDVQQGESHPVTKVRRFYRAGDPLLPSGLIGPVKIVK